MEQASPLHLARLARVQQQMAALGMTQLLVTDPDSVWYLTGYDNEPLERMMVFCVRADGQHIFFLNRLFPAPAAPWEQVWFSDTDDAVGALAARRDPAAPVGIDKTWSARFLLPLLERLPGCRPGLASDCVDHCRACKDPAEQVLSIPTGAAGSSRAARADTASSVSLNQTCSQGAAGAGKSRLKTKICCPSARTQETIIRSRGSLA